MICIKTINHPSPRPPVDAKTLAPTGLRSFVVHEEPRMVAVPQFLSPEESLGLGWPGDVQEFMVKKPVKHGEVMVFTILTMVLTMKIPWNMGIEVI